LEQGEGEDEGFGVEGFSSSGGFAAWAVAGELLDEVVDVSGGDGGECDLGLCFSWFHRGDFTSIPPIFEHPQSPL